MSCPLGTGHGASSSLTTCITWENTCALSQAVQMSVASGLWAYVTLPTCISTPNLVTWERTSHNSSHAKMCAVPVRPYHHHLVMTKETPCSFVSYALHPGSKILEGRKGRSFLSVCRQPDRPTVCRWNLAAAFSVGCWAEEQTALGKGCRGWLAQSSLVCQNFSRKYSFC